MREEFVNIDLIQNEKENRFELHYNNHFAYIDYEVDGNVWKLPHTIAPEELRGTGVAKALTLKVFALLKAKGVKIQPICSYLHGFIVKNPAWKEMVDEKYEKYAEL